MESERSCCLGYRCCKITGLTIGWFGVLLSGILIYGLCEHPARFGKSLHETIIPFLPETFFVQTKHFLSTEKCYHIFIFLIFCIHILIFTALNLVSSYSWIFGIDKNKPEFMLASLVWWGTNVCLMVICVISFYSFTEEHPSSPNQELYFTFATVYWVCSYIIAILCYRSIKGAHKIPQVDV